MTSTMTRSPALAFEELRPALQWLDQLLARAVERARESFAAPLGAERFRGLCNSDAHVDGMLGRQAGELSLGDDASMEVVDSVDSLRWLASTFGLDQLD